MRAFTFGISTISTFLATLQVTLAQNIVCGGPGALIGCPSDGTANGQGEILNQGAKISTSVIPTVISTIIGLLAFIAMAAFIRGGIAFIQAQGSLDKVKTAQKSMISAAVGLVLAISAYILVQIIANLVITPST